MFQSCPLVCSQLRTHPDNIVWSTHPPNFKRITLGNRTMYMTYCFLHALHTIHVYMYARDLWELHVAHEGERTHGDQFTGSIFCFYPRVKTVWMTMYFIWQSAFCLSCIEFRIVIFKSATLLMSKREIVGERNPRGSSCYRHFLILSLLG